MTADEILRLADLVDTMTKQAEDLLNRNRRLRQALLALDIHENIVDLIENGG